MKFLQDLVERRARVLPITNILKNSFGWVGFILGGAYGFSNSMKEMNGPVWRTTVGACSGGALGFTVGLFPYQAFGLLLVGDVASTMGEKNNWWKKKITC